MKDVVVIIKTFLRDRHLFRCVESLRSVYPDIKIAVCDDGRANPAKTDFYNKLKEGGHYVFTLPFNSGMTKGRNYIVENTREKYLLYIDDDFIFSKDVNIEKMIEILNYDNDLAMVAGRVRVGGEVKNYQGYIKIEEDKMIQTPLKLDNWIIVDGGAKYKYCDLGFNFYLVRRSVFDDVKYDETVKIGCAHSDFYMMVKKAGWKIAFTPDSIVDHEHGADENNEEYEKYRRVKDGYYYFAKKWKIKEIIYFDKSRFDLISLKRIYNTENIFKKIIKKILKN